MKKFKKPKIADNPLSKNIADRLNYKERSDAGFKAEIDRAIEKIKKFSENDGISDQAVISWIRPSEADNRYPSKNPKFESLEKLSIALKFKSLWDMYIDKERWVDKTQIALPSNDHIYLIPEQKDVIEVILQITSIEDLTTIKHVVESFLIKKTNFDKNQEDENNQPEKY